MELFSHDWSELARAGKDVDRSPTPIRARSQVIPPKSKFAPHVHNWHQLTYATEGVLTVVVDNDWYLVAPGQALWIPARTMHTTGTVLGASLASLYVADSAALALPNQCQLLKVSPFLRALIFESERLDDWGADYTSSVYNLILKQIDRLVPVPNSLPWPSQGIASVICQQIYLNPSEGREASAWADEFKVSKRTLARYFESETGMTLREWTQKLKSLKSLEMLAVGSSITEVSLSLGYASVSAFSFMFRQEFGETPTQYRKRLVSAA